VSLDSTYFSQTQTISDGVDKGIIPLTCQELFDRVEAKEFADPNVHFNVEVSYIEVCAAFLLSDIAYPV